MKYREAVEIFLDQLNRISQNPFLSANKRSHFSMEIIENSYYIGPDKRDEHLVLDIRIMHRDLITGSTHAVLRQSSEFTKPLVKTEELKEVAFNRVFENLYSELINFALFAKTSEYLRTIWGGTKTHKSIQDLIRA